MENLETQLKKIKRGAVEIVPENELKEKLKESIKSNTPLIVKAGFDPTAPDLHLGHTVLLRKMKHFIELGHKVIFLIGDYTGMIGDPTGKSKTRKQLTEEEVKKNAETYKTQISKVLDINKIEIVFNSKWLSKLTLKDIINLLAKQTVARILERDDFYKRYKNGEDISMVEFLYPLLQAYDSVALKSDIELGGTDQKFNLLLGRTIQKRYNQKGQIAIMMPLLEGIDGKEKMSKSLGNYIALNDTPKDMFGKLMSIPDELILKYMELLTDIPEADIEKYKREMKEGKNPRDIKIILAKEIVTIYYSKEIAEKEEKNFNLIFSKKVIPDDIPELNFYKILDKKKENFTAVEIAYAAAVLNNKNISKSEIKRLIKQGGVLFNNSRVKNEFEKYTLSNDFTVKIGKKILIKHKIK